MPSLLFWKLNDFSVAPWHPSALLVGPEAVCQDYSLFLGHRRITGEDEGFQTSCKTDHVCVVLITCFSLR